MTLPDFKPPVSEPVEVEIFDLGEVKRIVREQAIHAIAYSQRVSTDSSMSASLLVNGDLVLTRLDILARTAYGTPDMMSLRALQSAERSIHHYVLMYGDNETWFPVQQRFICSIGHSLSMSPLGLTVVKD